MITIALLLLLQTAGEDALRVRIASEYYAMWNGDFPSKLDELVTKPAKCRFWPDGGFLEKAPEVKYSTAGYVKRSENIDGDDPKLLTTRYRLAQIAAVLRLRGKAPASLDGFPKDGWGNVFTIVTGEGGYKIASPGQEAPAPAVPVTDDAKRKIAELVKGLSDEGLDQRATAAESLYKMGETILPILADYEAKTEDKETQAQLQAIITKRKAEIASRRLYADVLGAFVYSKPGGAAKERDTTNRLRTLMTAQFDFRCNDRDGNMCNDFWTADVFSLFALCPRDGSGDLPALNMNNAIKLIELSTASADAFPMAGEKHLGTPAQAFPVPVSGYLLMSARKVRTAGGMEDYRRDTSEKKRPWNHFDRYAVIAFPTTYGVTGTKTYYVDQDNTIYWKDTGGDPFFTIPSDARKDGWIPLD